MSVLRLFTGGHIAGRQVDNFLSTMALPRVAVLGVAGSGKSAVLGKLRAGLEDHGLAVHHYADDIDIEAIPAEEVLVVDDLHLLSAEQTTQVRRRAEHRTAGLIVSLRPWPSRQPVQDIERRLNQSAPPIILGQVTAAEILDYLTCEGRAVPRRCVDELLTLTGGATWLVTYALSIMEHPPDCRGGDAHLEALRDIDEQVMRRLDMLDAPLRRLIEHASLGTQDPALSQDDVAPDDLVRQGYAEGLLLRNGTPLPAVRAAVRGSLSQHWKVANSAVLAAGIAGASLDQDLSVEHLVTGVSDPRLTDALITRADRISGRDPERAGELYDVALTAGADASAVALRQARAAWAAGRLDLAAQLVDDELMNERHRDEPELLDLAAAIWSARDMMSTASKVYDAGATSRADAATEIRARIARFGNGDLESLEDGRPAAEESVPSTQGIAMRLLDRGLQLSVAGDCADEAISNLVRASQLYTAAGVTYPIPELPAVIAASVAVGAGDLLTAAHVLDAAVEGGQGGAWARRRLLLWQGLVATQDERATDARRALAAADEDPLPVSVRDARLSNTLHVIIARRHDDLPALEAEWASRRDRLAQPDVDLFTLFPLAGLLGAAARLGDANTLASHLRQGLELLERLGSPPLWANHVWWAGIQQGILLNCPDSLAPFAHALVRAADHSPLAATMARAGNVWIAVLAGKVDVDAVEGAARALGAVGLAWDGGRLAAHAARRAKERKAATRLLACARELHAKESPASGPAERKTPAPRTAENVAELSEREFMVASLVLEGKTYVEIGESLFISHRTVEHHVAHMRRRLNATSRSDLISKLRRVVGSTSDGAITRDRVLAHESPTAGLGD